MDPAPAPRNLPPPPTLTAPATEAKPSATAQLAISQTVTSPPPRPPKQRKTTRLAASTPTAASVSAPEDPPSTPTYRLGELRSAGEKATLRKQTEQLIESCNAALTAAEGKTLNGTQTEMLNRVRSFAQQAREVIDKDPGEARSLAVKARSFAEALLAELK